MVQNGVYRLLTFAGFFFVPISIFKLFASHFNNSLYHVLAYLDNNSNSFLSCTKNVGLLFFLFLFFFIFDVFPSHHRYNF